MQRKPLFPGGRRPKPKRPARVVHDKALMTIRLTPAEEQLAHAVASAAKAAKLPIAA